VVIRLRSSSKAPGCVFAVCAGLLLSLAPTHALATSGCIFCATPEAPFGAPSFNAIPLWGAARFGLAGAAVGIGQPASTPSSPRPSAAQVAWMEAAVGLPFFHSALRGWLPAVHRDDAVSIGSPGTALDVSAGYALGTSLSLRYQGSLGAVFRSVSASPQRVATMDAARDDTQLLLGLQLSLIHATGPSLGIEWSQPSKRLTLQVADVVASGQLVFYAGASPPVTSNEAAAGVAGIAYRPAWWGGAALRLFGFVPFSSSRAESFPGANSSVLGAAFTYDLALSESVSDPATHFLGTSGEGDVRELDVVPEQPVSAYAIPARVTVIEFFAVWCPPCRHVESDLRRIASENPDVAVRTVDADRATELVKSLGRGPFALPIVVVFGRNGEERGRVLGYSPREIERLVRHALE